MKVVLDTNVWVSGLLIPKSQAGYIISKWREAAFDIVVSAPILTEIERVLSYPKIAKRLQWDKDRIRQYIELLAFFTQTVAIDDCSVEVKTDPDDSAILATLVKSQANYLVSGDSDLLNLKEQYPIVSVLDFYQKITDCRNEH